MTKPPVRRAARRTTQAGRDPGAEINEPQPPSAATTAPRPMYDPDAEPGDSGPATMPPRENPLLVAAQRAERDHAEEAFNAEQRRRAVEVDEGLSADISVAHQTLGTQPGEGLSDEEQLAADIARVEKLHRSTFGLTQKLALPKRKHYHTHWFNAEGGRIDDAVANGWAHRLDNEKRPLKRAVGRGRDQGVLYAYAMDIPEMFWLDDMAARHKAAADKMEALKAQPFRTRPGEAQTADRGKFYDPTDSADGPLAIRKG